MTSCRVSSLDSLDIEMMVHYARNDCLAPVSLSKLQSLNPGKMRFDLSHTFETMLLSYIVKSAHLDEESACIVIIFKLNKVLSVCIF